MRHGSSAGPRFPDLFRESARFVVVGAAGFLVTDGVFNLIIAGHQAACTANASATLVATAVTFAGSRYWTFRHRERAGLAREAATFVVLNLIGILVQQACLELAGLAVGGGGKLALNAGFLAGVGLATVFRFWSYRRLVWASRPGMASPAPPARGPVRS